MPQPASTRLALVGPTGTDALSIGDDQIRAIITQLEAVAAGYIVDVAANRPAAAAANKGYAFVATDTGILSWSTGAAWVDVNPKDAAAGTASLRTLGTGATQAAAGNHDHAGVYQPLDSDLTAIAALTTTSFGRSILTAAAASALAGGEIGYDQITSQVVVTGTTPGGGTTIITCAAHTFDGSPVMAEFYCPQLDAFASGGGATGGVSLYEASTEIGQMATFVTQADYPLTARFRFTPSAGSHTYKLVGWRTGTTPTMNVNAGAGGAGALAPAFVRFVKA